MAVIEAVIASDLDALVNILKDETDQEVAIQKWKDELAKIIADAILSADVVAGIPVATTGTAAAQTGVTTSTGSLI